MKYIYIFLYALVVYGAQCPNFCSSHGSCNANGLCNCYPGWTEGDCSARTCPYGERIADPDGHNEENYLECSGQGHCNRVSGECECYPGYAGSACHRTECVNQCSFHGVCTKVGYLGITYNTYFNPYYYDGNYLLSKYESWDKESMYACVCDKEYTGYDCSQRKCPTGYKETSECDVPSIYTQTLAISRRTYTIQGTPSVTRTLVIDGCIAYAEYTDTFNRTWYTRPFNIFKDMTEEQYKDYKKKVEAIAKKNKVSPGSEDQKPIYCGYSTPQFPSLLEALKSLPSGTIDVTDVSINLQGIEAETSILIHITYGSQQTGRQEPIKIITADDYPLEKALKGGEDFCANVPQVKAVKIYPIKGDNTTQDSTEYLAELKQKYPNCPDGSIANRQNNLCVEDDFIVSYLRAHALPVKTSYIPPLECANNGICNRVSGLCECFEGYYGLACTEATPVV